MDIREDQTDIREGMSTNREIYLTDYRSAFQQQALSVDPTHTSLSTLRQRRLTSSVDIQLQVLAACQDAGA